MSQKKIKIFTDIGVLMTLAGVVKKQGRQVQTDDLSLIKKAAMVVEGDQIVWVGTQSRLPKSLGKAQKISLHGNFVYPGFIDSHTHLVFAGHRKNEFELRNQGVSYQQIAEAGGGIKASVQATRKASFDELKKLAQARVDLHLSQGVTTIEVKSGYGLELKTEVKILKVAQSLKKAKIVTTYLGAHAIPTEFKNEHEYVEQLKKDLKVIQKKKLSRRVDIFIEKSYFSPSVALDYLNFAKSIGFDLTLHADQMSRTGATELAIQLQARSADHVIFLNDSDRVQLARSETVAVLLPTADFYLQCPYPQARDLIDQGACVALASDFNPGSSPTQNISLVGLLARLNMKMSLAEVFAALTYGGARALGLEKNQGALLPDYKADFFVSDKNHQDWFYDLDNFQTLSTYVGGQKVFQRK